MCGLFGCYQTGPLSDEGIEVFNRLGVLSESRGKDSTGVASVERATVKKDKKWIIRTRRGLSRASNFLGAKTTTELVNSNPILLMGHTRLATHGSVNLFNTHPFEVGHIVGAHNGVVPALFDRKNDFTDSYILYKTLNKLGVPRGLRSLNEGYFGDMALTFINKSNDTFNLFTNGGRPLYLAKSKYLWAWASEASFLERVISKWDYLQPLPVDSLVSVRLGTERWRVSEYEYDRSKQTNPQVSLLCSYEKGGHIDTPVGDGGAGGLGGVPQLLGPTKPTVLAARYRTMPGVFMTRAAINELVKHRGCTLCLKKVISTLSNKLFFYEPMKFFCEECRHNDALVGQFYDETELHEGMWMLPSGKEVPSRSALSSVMGKVKTTVNDGEVEVH